MNETEVREQADLDTPRPCTVCVSPVDEHDLEQARVCLAAISEVACRELERGCGGSVIAALEREMRRPSPSWRS